MFCITAKPNKKHFRHKAGSTAKKTVSSVNSLSVYTNTSYFERFQLSISEDAVYNENDPVRNIS